MKDRVGFDRRSFMRAGVSLLSLVACGQRIWSSSSGTRQGGRHTATVLLDDLREALPRAGQLHGLGAAARRAMPGLAEALEQTGDDRVGREIEDRLMASLGEDAGSLRSSELRRRIVARTRGDFRAGRTVCIEGWTLARTEALLYAVLSVG